MCEVGNIRGEGTVGKVRRKGGRGQKRKRRPESENERCGWIRKVLQGEQGQGRT